jgi:hypothetical protein
MPEDIRFLAAATTVNYEAIDTPLGHHRGQSVCLPSDLLHPLGEDQAARGLDQGEV